MRKGIKQVCCTMIGMTLASMTAPMAQADGASFLAGARALGFQQSDDNLIRMALSACRFLQPNLRRDPIDVEAHIIRYAALAPASVPDPSRPPIQVPDAHQFLILSVNEYCPQLAYRLSG